MTGKTTNITSYQGTHTTLLQNTLHRWSKKEPDVQLISSEGCTVYTQKILLGFYSPVLSSILCSSEPGGEKPTISVPCTVATIKTLLTVLAKGKAYSTDKTILVDVAKVAKILGINFQDWSIPDKIEVVSIVKDEPDDGFENSFGPRIISKQRKLGKRKTKRMFTTLQKTASSNNLVSDKERREKKRKVKVEPSELYANGVGETLTQDATPERSFIQTPPQDTLDELDDVLSKYNALIEQTQTKERLVKKDDKTFTGRAQSSTSNKGKRGVRADVRKITKTDLDVKKFECEKCKKLLSSKSALKAHMYSHVRKSFKCDECDKAFSVKPTLKAHMKKSHTKA